MQCSDIIVRGVGQWLTRHMEEFFAESSENLSSAKGNVAGEGVIVYMVDCMSFEV